MEKSIKQFRWEHSNNNIDGSSIFESGQLLNDYPSIAQLGIQSLPGTVFYLNGSQNPIRIGSSGVFDLEIKEGIKIRNLCFSTDSIRRINTSGYLIVDILYYNGEGV